MIRSTHAARPLALAAGGMVLAVAACSGSVGQAPSPSSEPTATVTTTATQTATASATATSSVSASPTGSATPGGTAMCDVRNLLMRYADDRGGGGAGSVMGTFTLTNRGSESCTLRGFPGVSYVGGDAGTQVGAAATRTDDEVTTKTIAPGKAATVALRRTQPGNYGSDCHQAAVTGFRVYPPESTRSGFVRFTTTGCKSTKAPLLQVGPVT